MSWRPPTRRAALRTSAGTFARTARGFWASGSVRVLHDGKGRERGFLKIARDATEQKRAQVSLEQSLEQQQLLNREASHRIKNSLHLVASLLTLQARTLKDPESQRAITEAG